MAFLKAFIEKDEEEYKCRLYIAEMGRIGANNMAHAFGGSEVVKSLDEILSPGRQEMRSAEEIKEHIKKGLTSLVNKHEHESL